MLLLLGSLVVSWRFNGGFKEGKGKKSIRRSKILKRNCSQSTFYSYTWHFKTSFLDSSDMLAVISQAAYRSQVTGSHSSSAKAAHLLLLSFLEIIFLFWKNVKYCLTPTYGHLSLWNAPRSEPVCFTHLALQQMTITGAVNHSADRQFCTAQ